MIWVVDRSTLARLVKESTTFSGVLDKLGLTKKGSQINILRSRLDKDGIDYSHIPKGLSANKGFRRGGISPIPLESVLTIKSTYNRSSLKKRLVSEKLIQYGCAECGLKDVWNGKPLSLAIDHINGVSDDNRIDNLRFLCPNCHSQTDTFAGKNTKNQMQQKKCASCLTDISKKSTRCKPCASSAPKTGSKCYNIDPIELQELANKYSRVQIARYYKVSETTIRKWMIRYGTVYTSKAGRNMTVPDYSEYKL